MIVHHSLALETVINDMVSEKNVILDLGSMSTGSTGAFLKLKCRCYVEDLNEYIEDLNAKGGDPLQKLEDHLIAKPDGLKFDFVLCWDILNYLSSEVIEFLMKLLTPYFKEGTILHTMRYVGSSMPKRPGNFKILDNFKFQYQQDSNVARMPAISMSTVKMLKHMGTFTMRKTLMNQMGMQNDVTEHILEYGSAALAKNLKRNTHLGRSLENSYIKTFDNVSMPALSNVLQSTKRRPNNAILEASKKSGRRLNLLNSISQNLFIEDVYSLMAWHRKVAVNSVTSFSENTLLFSPDVSFDLVLLWDLFNFLQINQIEKMLLLLERHLSKGAQLHCILFKNDGSPDSPALFEIDDNLNVSVKGDVNGPNERSINNTAQLMKLMPHFNIKTTHFGRMGKRENFLEFIFEYKGR